MTAPEALARQQIDTQLAACGWAVQDYRRFDPAAGRGIALREVPLKSGLVFRRSRANDTAGFVSYRY